MSDKLEKMFRNHQKKMMILPILLILMASVFLVNTLATTGEIIKKDVSLSGGMSVTLYTPTQIDKEKLEQHLRPSFSQLSIRGLSEFGTEQEIGIVIETVDTDEETLKQKIKESTGIELNEENSSIEVVGSSLGDSFYKQMIKALIFAFIFMSIAILITFRKWVPSLAVVLVAFGDLVITVAILNLINMHISSAGIAALLLLIGYSIDTDVLLTTRILKRQQGSIIEGVISSMKTGLTMTTTTVAALGVAFIVSSSLILKQMFLIIIIGLLVDVILTYMLNAPLISLYAKKKYGDKE
jgi:preprotein translocase subunit SecF